MGGVNYNVNGGRGHTVERPFRWRVFQQALVQITCLSACLSVPIALPSLICLHICPICCADLMFVPLPLIQHLWINGAFPSDHNSAGIQAKLPPFLCFVAPTTVAFAGRTVTTGSSVLTFNASVETLKARQSKSLTFA